MSSLALLDRLNGVISALRGLQLELDGMPPQQREAVLNLSWPQVPSFEALRDDLIRWGDRLGAAEPELVDVPETLQLLHALFSVVRKARQAAGRLPGTIGASPKATTELRRRVAGALGALHQAARELDALRWLGPILLEGVAAVDFMLVPEQPLATRVGSIAAPFELAGEVRLDLPASLLVRIAPGALETVLYHLLDNAATHAPGAAVRVQARVSDGSERHKIGGSPCVLLTVSDTGPGIPYAQQPSLFEQRLRGEGRKRHLACGLWLCRCILNAHGGEIWLDRTDVGASFSAAWPIAALNPDVRAKPRSIKWPVDPQRFGQALRYTRDDSELTREELAELAGVSDSTIKNLEYGKGRATKRTRRRLINALEGYRQATGPAAGFFERDATERSKAPTQE